MTSPGVPGAADGTVPERAARATAGLVPGGLDWARAMDELAEDLLRADGPAGRAVTGLDAAIAVRREAIGRLDGDLAASAGLDLRNNLAVDEALSPAASFVLAGAGTVTARVWPVDDETAAAFMADYRRQLAAGTEPARALSQIQVAWSASRPAFAYAPRVIVQRPHATAAS